MKADNITLLEFIGASKRTFYIPVYQRNYDWKREQCETLFRDIEAIAVAEHRSSHFLGTIVYVDGESTANFSAFTVIDGQQRLTTIMILLKAIAESTEDEDLKADIIESYLTNRRCPETLRIKLKPMKSDAENYQKLIDDKVEDMGNSQILTNYNLFRDLISKSKLSPEVLYDGIQKLEIVYIKLDQSHENPQLVFESLNSTGLDLTQADLIRNFLLMSQDYQKQEQLYNTYWVKLEKMLPDTMISDYARDYLTLKTGVIPNKEKVYEVFKRYYNSLENYDSEGFMEELTAYGKYYSWFKYCDSPDESINQRLRHLQKLKSTVVYPFLLSLFEDCFMYKKIDEKELCDTLDIVLSYVMRRLLCEMPTNALNKVFATLAKDVEKNTDDVTTCEKVVTVLASKQGKAGFPNDRQLEERIINRDSYKFPHIKFVLEQIERLQTKETVEFEELTIEHIMPRTLSAKWNIDLGKRASEIHDKYLNCLGNLTLSGYNSELSNGSFEDKKGLYAKSNICITKSLCEYDHWSEDTIKERCDLLSKEIEKIWACPELINNKEIDTDIRTEFDLTDDANVTGRTPIEVDLLGDIYPVSTWKDFFITVCKFLYEYDAQVFRSLTKHNDFKGKTVRIIDEVPDNMRKPYKIADDLYIETNRSANDILNYTRLMMEKFDDMEELCSYKLKAVYDGQMKLQFD